MQDAQRRALIFSVLDDMKNEGVKVTAQKLATQAKMGKQTVLPYYREWQELEILGSSEDVDLSQELVRVLKREIAKEKFRQGEQLLALQDQLDEERENYSAQSELWHQQQEQLQADLHQQEQAHQALEQSHAELIEQEQALRQKLTTLADKEESLLREIEKLEERLHKESERSEKALAEQERRLDESHAKIVDHWLKVLDEERRDKTRLQKQMEKLDQERSTLSKEKARSEDLYTQERKAHQNTLEQLSATEQKLTTLQEQQVILDKANSQLNNPDDLIVSLTQLQQQAAEAKQLAKSLTESDKALSAIQQNNSSLTAEMETINKENRTLSEQVIRLEARLEGFQLAANMAGK